MGFAVQNYIYIFKYLHVYLQWTFPFGVCFLFFCFHVILHPDSRVFPTDSRNLNGCFPREESSMVGPRKLTAGPKFGESTNFQGFSIPPHFQVQKIVWFFCTLYTLKVRHDTWKWHPRREGMLLWMPSWHKFPGDMIFFYGGINKMLLPVWPDISANWWSEILYNLSRLIHVATLQ